MKHFYNTVEIGADQLESAKEKAKFWKMQKLMAFIVDNGIKVFRDKYVLVQDFIDLGVIR